MTDTVWREATEPRGCDGDSREYQFAETDDPRVLAVIQRDDDEQISQLYDGDAINPIIYVTHHYGHSFEWVAGYDGGEAAIIQRANDQHNWNWPTVRRYLWIFHGIAAEDVSGGYDRDGNWLVLNSRAFREHIGATEPESYDEAREDCKAIAQDLEDALDGYVYGAGYATNEARRLPDDEPIDLTDGSWDINIECWGLVGTEYARRTALDFDYGRPTLPEMLEVPA